MAQPLRATLDQIAAAIPIGSTEAATIVYEVTIRLERWIRTKHPSQVVVPSIEEISLTRGGSLWWYRGRPVPAAQAIPAVGSLLDSLLPRGGGATRIPAGLLYLVGRATEPGHLAPFSRLDEFRMTLGRYAAQRRTLALDALLARFFISRSGLPPLGADSSIADVRRLRRSGGVALGQIAEDTAIPISLLRELEWGVYTAWDLAISGPALASYAERAGLDAATVARVIEREQALAISASDAGGEGCARAVRPDFARVSLPFALATVLIGAVIVATPADTLPRQALRPAPGVHRDAPMRTAEPASSLSRPVPAEPRGTGKPAPATHRRSSLRAPATIAAAHPRRRLRQSEQSRHPLLRLARALAGDGKYRAEPFPKPR